MASTLADSVRRRLEDELKKTLLKACDDSDKSDPKTSGFAALADLKRLDLTGEAMALSGMEGSLRPHGAGPGAEATDSTSAA